MKYTVVFIFSHDLEKILMIRKTKGPYPGCLNGVGGKIEDSDRNGYTAALREVKEETGIELRDMKCLRYEMKIEYTTGTELYVFYAVLKEGVHEKQMEEEILEWHLVKDMLNVQDKILAGDGNIPYFINYALNEL